MYFIIKKVAVLDNASIPEIIKEGEDVNELVKWLSLLLKGKELTVKRELHNRITRDYVVLQQEFGEIRYCIVPFKTVSLKEFI